MRIFDVLQVFPEITICKVSQLNALYTDTMNYSSYISDTLSRKARWPLSRVQTYMPDITEDDYKALWSYFESKDGFYNSLPLNIQLTQNEEAINNPFVIRCYASMWDESAPRNCSEMFPLVWHRKYYKCRSLQLPDSLRRVRITDNDSKFNSLTCSCITSLINTNGLITKNAAMQLTSLDLKRTPNKKAHHVLTQLMFDRYLM